MGTVTEAGNDTFLVRQGVDPDYLANILTKDITARESIFELVDNAVDAARDRLLELKDPELDKYGLPNCYEGNWIAIRFGRESVAFLDNCSGIAEEALADRTFVIGAMSRHPYGIGRFGIGLKRALFRLGKEYALSTDTGTFAARMKFASTQLERSNSTLVASRHRSSGRAKTFIHISDLREGVLHEFGTESWIDDLSKSLSRRYGIFIEKGFKIFVNGRCLPSFGPKLRNPGPIKVRASNLPATEQVRVFIDSGMHEEYRLKAESDYNKEKILNLTDQFGWYFVCNDRIVEIAKHEPALGWTSKWHQEYYGFVGWIRFVASDAAHLPWDTKKSLIDPNSAVFRAISNQLQQFAEDYKTDNKKARKKQNTGTQNPDPKASGTENGSEAKPATTPTGAGTKRTAENKPAASASSQQHKNGPSEADHNENWRTLLPPVAIGLKHTKLNALIVEATQLELTRCYSASMLFRSIVETALFAHLKQSRSYGAVCEMVFAEMAKDAKSIPEHQKRTFRPSLNQALEWLKKNDSYFPDDVRRDCIFARNKLGNHLKELNGIVHEGDLTSSSKLEIMRNDTMPLLEFLLDIDSKVSVLPRRSNEITAVAKK